MANRLANQFCSWRELLVSLTICLGAAFGQEPPVIVREPPVAVTDQIGSITSLSCLGQGTEPLRYQWHQFAGYDRYGPMLAPVRGATNETFAPNFLSDSISYVCVVSNAWGAATSRVSTIYAPLWVSTTRIGEWRTTAATYEIAHTNKLAFAAVTTGAVEVISLANPAKPELVSQYKTIGPAADIAIENGVAFVACGTKGVEVVDYTVPDRPVRQSVISQATDFIEVQNGTAFLGRFDSRQIHVADIRTPGRPRMAGELSAYYIDGFAVGNGRLAANIRGGVRIADVSNPDAPSWLGAHLTGDYGVVLAIVNDLVFVAGSVIYTLSITNPAAPRVENGFGLRSSSCSLSGTLVVTADWIYDVSTPRQAALVGYYTAPGIRSVVKDGNLLVGASNDGTGISILEIESGPPRIVGVSGDIEVVLGPFRDNRALLSIDARGAAPLRYDWFFGETGDTSRPLVNALPGSLFVWDAWVSGSPSPHKIWARVSNVGAADSQTFVVTIRPTIAIQRSVVGMIELVISAHADSVWAGESSSDLTAWRVDGELRLPKNAMQLAVPIEPAETSPRFYRVRGLPPIP